MSVEAMGWAFDQEVPPSEKFVLVALADACGGEHPDDDQLKGHYCWPSIRTLRAQTCLGETTVKRHIRSLEQRGLIRRDPRVRPNGSRTSNFYELDPRVNLAGPDPKGSQERLSVGDEGKGVKGETQWPPGSNQVQEALLRVTAAKPGAALDEDRALAACRKYADRDVFEEAAAFAFWHLDGRGQNRRPRNIAQSWENWLRQAPPKDAPRRKSMTSRNDRLRDRLAELDRMKEDLPDDS